MKNLKYNLIISIFLLILLSPVINQYFFTIPEQLAFPLSKFNQLKLIQISNNQIVFYFELAIMAIGTIALIELLVSKRRRNLFLRFFFVMILIHSIIFFFMNSLYTVIFLDEQISFFNLFFKFFFYQTICTIIWGFCAYWILGMIEDYNKEFSNKKDEAEIGEHLIS